MADKSRIEWKFSDALPYASPFLPETLTKLEGNNLTPIDGFPANAAYNRSLKMISDSLVKLVKQYRVIKDIEANTHIEDSLIDSFLDLIQKCCHDYVAYVDGVIKIRKELHKTGILTHNTSDRDFYKDIREWNSHAINLIKHNSCTIRWVEMGHNSIRIPGFYIEGANSEGIVGPVTTLHPIADPCRSAVMFLNTSTSAIIQTDFVTSRLINKSPFSAAGLCSTSASSFDEIIRSLCTLDSFVFPHEVFHRWSSFNIDAPRGNRNTRLRVKIPNETGGPNSIRRGRIHSKFDGDGYSKSFLLPMLGENYWKEIERINPAGSRLIDLGPPPKDFYGVRLSSKHTA